MVERTFGALASVEFVLVPLRVKHALHPHRSLALALVNVVSLIYREVTH